MLQAAAITELLSRLISDDDGVESGLVRPHTALLSLVDSSELYAVASKLVEPPPARSAVASLLASTAAAAGTPPPSQLAYMRAAPLTLDERAACLSAIAVTAWRQAAESSTGKSGKAGSDAGVVVMAGASVSVARHAAMGTTGMADARPGKELVPLLLESDLGRILVMPIVPAPSSTSPSRNEAAHDDADVHEDTPAFVEHSKPFMLLTLNASCSAPPATLPKSPATPNVASPALTSSVATLSANNARARLRSGGTTPTSTRSEHTPTPSRSPVSDHFPSGSTTLPSHAPAGVVGEADTAAPSEAEAASEWDAKQWAALYAQAKALARVLAPSLAQSGVAHDHHDDPTAEGRHSALVSDDEADA